MRASTPKENSPDPSLLTPPHTRRMPRECRAPVPCTGTRASTKGGIAAASRILADVDVSNDPAIVNRSNRRATLDIRALNVNFVGDEDKPDLGDVEPFLTHVTKDFVDNDFDGRVDIIHEAITEIELNAPPGAPPEPSRKIVGSAWRTALASRLIWTGGLLKSAVLWPSETPTRNKSATLPT